MQAPVLGRVLWQPCQPGSLTRSHDEDNGGRDEHPGSVAGVNSLELRFLSYASNIVAGGGHKPTGPHSTEFSKQQHFQQKLH